MNIEDILQIEDRVRADVAGMLGDCVWSLGYDRQRDCLELELMRHLSDDEAEGLCSQFSLNAFYMGEGSQGSLFQLSL